MKSFNLYEMSDCDLEANLKLDPDSFAIYIGQIIEKFYPNIVPGTDEFKELIVGYRASFEAEKLVRINRALHNGFRVIYTKTGLIRNLINEIYFNLDDLVVH